MSSDTYATLEEALEQHPNAIAVLTPSENWMYKNNPNKGRYVPIARLYSDQDGDLTGVPAELTPEAKAAHEGFIGYCVGVYGYIVAWKADDFEIRYDLGSFNVEDYYYGQD